MSAQLHPAMNGTRIDWPRAMGHFKFQGQPEASNPKRFSRDQPNARHRNSCALEQPSTGGRLSRARHEPRDSTWAFKEAVVVAKAGSTRSTESSSGVFYGLSSSPIGSTRSMNHQPPSHSRNHDRRHIGSWCEIEPERLSSLHHNISWQDEYEDNDIDPLVVPPWTPAPPGLDMPLFSSDYAFCLCCNGESESGHDQEYREEIRINGTWCLRKPEAKVDAQCR